jgi:hypothetical protein
MKLKPKSKKTVHAALSEALRTGKDEGGRKAMGGAQWFANGLFSLCRRRSRSGFRMAEGGEDTSGMQQEKQHERKNAAHHQTNKKKHDAVNTAREKAARDIPNDAPNGKQNEKRADHAELDPIFLPCHSVLSPGANGIRLESEAIGEHIRIID